MDYLTENLLSNISEWKLWAPRENISPIHESSEKGEIIRTKSFYDYGKWMTVADVQAGESYELKGVFSVENIPHPKMSTRVIFDSYDVNGKPVQTEYAVNAEKDGDRWTFTGRFTACAGAVTAEISVMVNSVENGTVLIHSVSLRKIPKIGPRNVRVATTYISPYVKGEQTPEKRWEKVLKTIDNAGAFSPDIILLSEGIANRELPRTDNDRFAMTYPGKETEELGEKARKYNTYIIFNNREKAPDGLSHNSSVLIDRQGKIQGVYRKVHLTYAEYLSGQTPGQSFPVFDTDFGRIGTITCFDQFFAESVEALAIQGAEIVFLPTAGDGHFQTTSRAMENGIYLCVSGVNHSKQSDEPISRIIAPSGVILSGTNEDMGVAVTTIDLNKPTYSFWFSVGPRYADKRLLYMAERRPVTYDAIRK